MPLPLQTAPDLASVTALAEALDTPAFQAIAEVLPHAVFTCLPDGAVDYLNGRWREATGQEPGEGLGDGWLAALVPEDRERIAPVWAAAVDRGEACELEYRVTSPARGARWFAARVLPIRDSNGRLVRWFGTATDLEPFKRHEARLAFLDEASQLLASSLDHEETLARVCALAVPRLADWCAIDLVDEDGVLSRLALVHRDPAKLAIAERARRKLAPDPNEPGSTYAQLRSKQSILIPAIDDRYLASRLADPEVLELTRGLGLRSAMAVPLVSRGSALGVLSFVSAESGRQFGPEDLKLAEELAQRAAFAVDSANLYRSAQLEISQRQRTEARLRDETSLVEALNRVGKALAAELDLDRLVQTLTDEATALTGAQFGAFFYNVQNARGESYMLYALSGVDRSHFEKFPMPRNTAVFAPTFRGEGVVRLHDVTADPRYGHNAPHHGMPKGHLPVRSYLAAPVTSHSGEVLGGLFFGHAEPGRFDERAERALVGISSQASIAVENARLYQRAQEAVTLRDEFLSVASHELRTPVTSLKLVAHSLSRSVKDGNLAAVEVHAGKIHRQLERAARMVDALLDVSRISSGKLHLEPERLELAGLVREVCARLSDELARSGSSLTLELAEPLEGEWDRLRLEQAVTNLVANAAKYGEGKPIAVSLRRVGQSVLLSVTDQGIGISSEHHQRIFERFERGHPGRPFAGFGIGLFVVKNFIEAMGGQVRVRSAPAQGATFEIELPLRVGTP